MKVLGAGAAILDILMKVDDSFLAANVGGGKGGMIMVDGAAQDAILAKAGNLPVSREMGGSAGNTVSGLARLGMASAMLGKVGADSDGDLYRSSFGKIGGDISRFKISKDVHTGRCLSMITPDSERTMRTNLGASATLAPSEVTEADFAGITHVHVEGYLMFAKDLFMHVLKLAKKSGCTVSLDLASYEVVKIFKADLPSILADYVDIVFANEDEAREFCSADDFSAEAVAEVLGKYCKVAVVKLGKSGSLVRIGGVNHRVEANLVSAVDTTGAGDLWQAGFLYGYLSGKSPEISGKMGSILGAEVVQVIGAAIPEKRWPEIRKAFASL